MVSVLIMFDVRDWDVLWRSLEGCPILWHNEIYYINTSEIPSELSRENFISSHVKITCYLHTWRDHRRYGYIINCAFESKLIWYFTGVYIINRILHTRLWIWILPLFNSKIKFISMSGHVISSIIPIIPLTIPQHFIAAHEIEENKFNLK